MYSCRELYDLALSVRGRNDWVSLQFYVTAAIDVHNRSICEIIAVFQQVVVNNA